VDQNIILYQKKLPLANGIKKLLLNDLGLIVEHISDIEELIERLGFGFSMLLIDLDDFSDEELDSEIFTIHSKNIIVFSVSLDRYKKAKIPKDRISEYEILNDTHDLKHLVKIIKTLLSNAEKKVLILSEDMDKKREIAGFLQKKNFHIASLSDFTKLLANIKETKYSALIIVLQKEIDSIIIKHIRGRYSSEELPIIAVVDNGSDDISSLKYGANELIRWINEEEFCIRVTGVIENSENISTIKNLATKDLIAEINNLNYFFETAEKFYESAKRSHIFLTFAIIDIDGLGEINKKYGFFAGNTVIKNIASLLDFRFRESDLLCYANSGRFYVLAQNMNLKSTETVFEGVRQKIEQLEIVTNSGTIKTTVSIGVNTYLERNLEEMIDGALGLLLNSKKVRGNGVSIA